MTLRSDLLASLRHPALLVWSLFVLTIPFYVVASGLPQPGNALIVVLLPMALRGWNRRLPPQFSRAIRPLSLFALWSTVVSLAWAIFTGKLGYLSFPLYYAFNTIVFMTALLLHRRHGAVFLRLTVQIVLLAVMIQVIASFAFSEASYRGELFFNNPNQLGYYALLAATVIALSQQRVSLGRLHASVGLTGAAYLAVLSASRAAVGGIALLVILLVFSNPRIILVASLAALALLTAGGPVSNALDVAHERVMMNRDPETSFASERGYDRLWSHKELMLIGAGEGDFQRFSSDPKEHHEIHSSPATILFSYGVAGAILFLLFVSRVLEGVSLRTALFLVPPLFYTLSHQGLRFTMLWVVLAIFVAHKCSPSRMGKHPPLRYTEGRG